jgi:hypothetical protein
MPEVTVPLQTVVVNTEAAGAQDGRADMTLLTWDDTGNFLQLVELGTPLPFTSGMVFDLSAVAGTPFRPTSATLTLQASVRFPSPDFTGTIRASVVPDQTPAFYSGPALLPTLRSELFLADSASFDFTAVEVPVEIELAAATLGAVVDKTGWNGLVAISLELVTDAPSSVILSIAAAEHATSQAPTLSITGFNPTFTGLRGGPPGRARAVRDGRYGMGGFSDELVEDGEVPGLWVRPWDRDPREEEAEYKPSPREGVVDDEIPDLE